MGYNIQKVIDYLAAYIPVDFQEELEGIIRCASPIPAVKTDPFLGVPQLSTSGKMWHQMHSVVYVNLFHS